MTQAVRITLIALIIGTLIAFALASASRAADLGGTCCADLEERVAELEATTARKGNRKVALTIYGQVSASLVNVDVSADALDDTRVVQDGREETFLGFRIQSAISEGLSAGAVLELDFRQLGLPEQLTGVGLGTPNPGTRQAYVWVKSDNIGALRIGRSAQATRDFNRISVANTTVATLPNSLQPLSDTYLTGIDLPYDGRFRDVVRYDSPALGGFMVSASWGAATTVPGEDGNTWDVALRYAGEIGQFRAAAGVGYRHDEDFFIEVLDITTISIPTGDVTTMLASGSLMHIPTGLFASAYWAEQEWDEIPGKLTLESWTLQAGLENKLFTNLGKTTLYAEYGETDLELGPGKVNVPIYGLGVVQAIDPAALDVYATFRQIDLDDLAQDENVDVFSAGARVRF